MTVQVRAKLTVGVNVGFDDRSRHVQTIILGLAHEDLGDGGNGSLALDLSARIDVGDLGVADAQDVQHPVVSVHVAGDRPFNDFQPLFVPAQRKLAQAGQVGDQVSGVVIGGAKHIAQFVPVPKQIHHDILFLVQIKAAEKRHGALQSPACGNTLRRQF